MQPRISPTGDRLRRHEREHCLLPNQPQPYPLSQTPLRYLLSDRIDLMKDTDVVNVTADDRFISVTIEEKHALVGTSRFLVMVGAKDGQLKQWTVTDPQGADTTVALYNLDTTKISMPSGWSVMV